MVKKPCINSLRLNGQRIKPHTADMTSKDQQAALAKIREKLARATSSPVDRRRRKLSQVEKNRAAKLKSVLQRLKAGQHIQNRMLKTWLTPEEFANIAISWQLEKAERANTFDKPTSVSRYEALLRRADFLYNKADALSQLGKKSDMGAADAAYERALEYLQEQVGLDVSLQGWFDRPLDFGYGSMLGLDPDSVPRSVTSRSLKRQTGQMHEKKRLATSRWRLSKKLWMI